MGPELNLNTQDLAATWGNNAEKKLLGLVCHPLLNLLSSVIFAIRLLSCLPQLHRND